MGKLLSKLALSLGALVLIGFAPSVAKAELVQLSPTDLTGQGIGATLTVLTLQATGGATTESGGVRFLGGVTTNIQVFGDFSPPPGDPKNQAFTLSQLGITSAGQLALVVNLDEANNENPPTVTAIAGTNCGGTPCLSNTITLNVYDTSGMLLDQHIFDGGTLTQVASGVGGSGLVFGLDANEQAELNALITSLGANGLVFTVGATFGGVTGGPETIQAVRLNGTAAPVPEPATMILLGTGLAGVAAKVRKRRRGEPEAA